jgi:hypothetical protein
MGWPRSTGKRTDGWRRPSKRRKPKWKLTMMMMMLTSVEPDEDKAEQQPTMKDVKAVR